MNWIGGTTGFAILFRAVRRLLPFLIFLASLWCCARTEASFPKRSFIFNDGDRVASIHYPNSGPTITNEYFAGGTLKQVRRVGSGTFTNYYSASAANFDAFGRVLQFAFGNGLTTTRSNYPTSQRLYSLTVPGVFNRDYRYSTGEDVTYLNGSGLAPTTVTYDNLHRIKTYTGLPGTGFAYDAVGNITTHIESGSAQTFGYGSARKQAVKSAFGKTYLYDLCGNMIVRHGGTTNSQALEYDAENRLVRFSEVGRTAVEFGYADGGARLWRRSYVTGTNSAKVQIWIGNIYEEKDGKTLFHVFASGQRVCTFERDSILNGGSGTSTNYVGYFYHQDHLGSSSVLSDYAGSLKELSVFYPFGRTQTNNPTAAFKVSNQFTGQIQDEETGLYYYNARYYDPELGRFIQADTIIPDLSNPQSFNRYAYVLNNPLRYTDPDGHGPKEWAKATGQFVGGVFVGTVNVANPVPIQIRGDAPPPSTMPEYYGRKAGEVLGLGISVGEIIAGVDTAATGGGMALAGAGATAVTGGTASPVSVPAMAAGGGLIVVGAAETTSGILGINNFMVSKTEKPKTYQTYTKKNPKTGKTYSGRTSGTGSAEENIADRDAGHHMNEKGYGPAKLDKSSSNKDAIRGREQQNIEKYGGAQSTGGSSGNAINSVSPNNQNATKYEKAAEKEFGKP